MHAINIYVIDLNFCILIHFYTYTDPRRKIESGRIQSKLNFLCTYAECIK